VGQRGVSYGLLVKSCLVLIGLLVLGKFVLQFSSAYQEEMRRLDLEQQMKREAISKIDMKFRWSKFLSRMSFDEITFQNKGSHIVKDFTITCDLEGNSGTVISNITTKAIYERLEPGQTKSVRGLNMGEIDSRVTTASCEIVDLIVEK
jgi:hypothetical protein